MLAHLRIRVHITGQKEGPVSFKIGFLKLVTCLLFFSFEKSLCNTNKVLWTIQKGVMPGVIDDD